MRKTLTFTLLLLVASAALACGQYYFFNEREPLEFEKFVLVLKDGEQLVIRGDYEIDGDLVRFYLDSGNHPVYASVKREAVDFEATQDTTEFLRVERLREKRYFMLVEERRRRLMEESGVGRGRTSVFVAGQAEDRAGAQVNRQAEFPPYDPDILSTKTETWWRDEAARLFDALDEANSRVAEAARRGQALTAQYNEARTERGRESLRPRIEELGRLFTSELDTRDLVANRLTEISLIAEELEVPFDWLLPPQSRVFDTAAGAGRAEATGPHEEREYTEEDLADAGDDWWLRERGLLEGMIEDSRSRLAAYQGRYEELRAQWQAADDEGKRLVDRQIKAVQDAMLEEQAKLDATESRLDKLIAVARSLGREASLGMMKEREEEQP